jgi:hypothetical protein
MLLMLRRRKASRLAGGPIPNGRKVTIIRLGVGKKRGEARAAAASRHPDLCPISGQVILSVDALIQADLISIQVNAEDETR